MEDPREKLKKELEEEENRLKEELKEELKEHQAKLDGIDRIGSIIVSIIYAGGMVPLILMFSKDIETGSRVVYLWLASCLFIACIANIFDKILKGIFSNNLKGD